MSRGNKVGIAPRKMQFNSSNINPSTYYADDPVMSTFWNTLSMLFPEGESFFVKSVRHYRSRINDSILQDKISGFIGQEAFHTLGHKEFNAVLEKQGYPVKQVDIALNNALQLVYRTSPVLALYITAILEHYTATLAMQLISNPVHNASVSTEARGLWLHHAVEEVEHRAVSYDVLKAVDPNNADIYLKALFIPVSLVFAAVVAVLFSANLSKQKLRLKDLKSIWKLGVVLLENKKAITDWFRTDFHPEQHCNSESEKAAIMQLKQELRLK